MKKSLKKIISIIISVMMVVSVMPFVPIVAEAATINSYATLQAAIDAAPTDDSPTTISITGTISDIGDNTIVIKEGQNITFTSSKSSYYCISATTTDGYTMIENHGTLTFGKYASWYVKNSLTATIVDNYGTFNISGLSPYVGYSLSTYQTGKTAIKGESGSTFSMTNTGCIYGEVSMESSAVEGSSGNFFKPVTLTNCDVDFDGSTFKTNASLTLNNCSGTINGGTFNDTVSNTSNSSDVTIGGNDCSGDVGTTPSAVSITGGTFLSTVTSANNTITGGTFTLDDENALDGMVADGYHVSINNKGTYDVIIDGAILKLVDTTTHFFTSVDDYCAYINTMSTSYYGVYVVTLLDDVSYEGTIPRRLKTCFDLNEHTLTGTGDGINFKGSGVSTNYIYNGVVAGKIVNNDTTYFYNVNQTYVTVAGSTISADVECQSGILYYNAYSTTPVVVKGTTTVSGGQLYTNDYTVIDGDVIFTGEGRIGGSASGATFNGTVTFNNTETSHNLASGVKFNYEKNNNATFLDVIDDGSGRTVEKDGDYYVVDNSVAINVDTGVKYDSLFSAITNALDGETVKLTRDVTENSNILKHNVIIDLNDHTYTCKGSYAFQVKSSYAVDNVTVKNGKIDMAYTGTSNVYPVYIDRANTNFTIDSVTVETADSITSFSSSSYYAVFAHNDNINLTIKDTKVLKNNYTNYMIGLGIMGNNCTFDIEDSVIEGNNWYGCTQNGSYSGCKYTVKNTTFKDYGTEGSGFYMAGDNESTFTDCTFEGYESGMEIRAGTVTLDNCDMTSNATEFKQEKNPSGTTTVGSALVIVQHTTNYAIDVTVDGGVYKGVYAIDEIDIQDETATDQISFALEDGIFVGKVLSEDCTKFISGGHYSEVPDASYLADGLHVYDHTNVTECADVSYHDVAPYTFSTIDKTALKAAIDEVNVVLNQSQVEKIYTASTLEALKTKVAESEAVYNDVNATQSAVDSAATAVETQKTSLVYIEYTVKVNKHADDESSTYTTSKVHYGDVYDASMTELDEGQYIYKWTMTVNGVDSNLNTASKFFSQSITDNTVLDCYVESGKEAEEENKARIVYIDKSNKVIKIDYATIGTAVSPSALVEAPTVAFYEFNEWEVYSGTPDSVTSEGVVYKASYSWSKAEANKVLIIGLEGVVVNGAEIKYYDDENGKGNQSRYEAYYDEYIKLTGATNYSYRNESGIDSEISGITGGYIYAPQNPTTLYILPVETEEASTRITGWVDDTDSSNLIFNAHYYTPSDCQFVEAGVVIAKSDVETPTIGGTGCAKLTSSIQGAGGEYSISIGYIKSATIKAASYLTYKDADGIIHTVYSETRIVSYGS